MNQHLNVQSLQNSIDNVYGSHSYSYKSHANLFLQICIHAWLIPSTLRPILKNSMYFIAKMPQSPLQLKNNVSAKTC